MKFDDIEIGEDENFAEMFEASEHKTQANTIVDGVIIEINDDNFLVDVGQKSEGKLYLSEITIDGIVQYKVGDTIKVMMMNSRGERPSISYKKVLQKEKFDTFIKEHGEEPSNLIVEGKVVSVKNRAGFIVEGADGTEYFMPMAQGFLKAIGAVGKTIKAVVLSVKADSNSIIISRRKLIEEDQQRRKEMVSKLMEDNTPKTGIIKKITSYGMFVDIGGIDGLVNYNEISYRGPVNPSKYYDEGEEVIVVIKSFDKDKGHLSLSIKAALPDPWEEMNGSLDKGDTITVTVSNFETYGAFVDLGNDVEGLLHISEISWDKHAKNPQEYLNIGDEINVEVIDLDFEKRRLRVSLKSLQKKPFKQFVKTHKVGDIVRGCVATLTDFGAFVNFGSVDGLLHNEEVNWDNAVKCKEKFNKGDEIEAKIIKIDIEKENISLSLKSLLESPADIFANEHSIGDIVSAEIKDIKDFGIFLKLANNLDGLIRREDLIAADEEQDQIKIGDVIESVIVNIDKQRNRVRLSRKRLESQQQKDILKNVNDNSSMTFGDVLSGQLK
ncbi:SSU ribosomal protein S1p [hydrothermal vent metagenome]|uniref:SSU ribosomal protein S1p n=1 Tax=hydrothermal vent metagenome TaxID=652676 RepID=A0A3B1E5C7_9ZZZZ